MASDAERLLGATWLNTVAAGLVSGGTVSQAASVAGGAAPLPCLLVAAGCLAGGLCLHALALRRVRPRRPDGAGSGSG